MKARILLFFVLWAGVAAVVFSIPGCYGRNCEGDFQIFGIDGGQGHMVDTNTWESNAYDEAWLPFPRQRGYGFDITALGGRRPINVTPWLSANELQNQSGANAVIGAGNIAETLNWRNNGIDIRNDTCSDYYLRLVVEVPDMPPAAPTSTAPVTDAGP
jgi:hypothetical protein